MQAVILVGGKGERLMPLTRNTRKAYLPLGNKRVVDHIIDRLPKGMPSQSQRMIPALWLPSLKALQVMNQSW